MKPIRFKDILIQPEDVSYLGPFTEAGKYANMILVLKNGVKITFQFTEVEVNNFIEMLRKAYENTYN